MAKMLKHFVLGLKKNPPAPPRPDYEAERLKVEEAARFFDGPDYENLPKSKAKTQVQFAADKKQDLVVFDNYSEPADFAPKVVGEAEEDPLYMSPLDDRGTAPPLEEEDMYCLPYEQQSADERRTSDVVREEATYDVVPDVKSSDEEEDNNESRSKREDEPKEDEYDEPWEWTVGARLTSSLQVSPAQSLDGSDPEEDEDKMAARRQQRRLLYETAFDSRVKDHLDDRLFSKGDESVARAASRSSFGSTSGSSASSTPTHQPMEIARHSPRRNLVRDGRSLSPRDSSIRNQIVNQNFERRISFSSSQWDSVSRSSGSSDPSSSRESMNLETHSHRSHQNAKKVLSAQDPELKENNASPPPGAARKSRPSSLLSEVKPDNVPPQSPENDVRCSEDYDPPWDVKKKRPTGSVSVPERLSSQPTPPMPTSVTHEQLEEAKPQRTTGPSFRATLNLNLQADSPRKARQNLTLNFGCSALATVGEKVDPQLTLEKQGWYHGSISRVEAEAKLRVLKEGSYLVRNSESSKHDYSLSLKSARGFMHMKIVVTSEGRFILGQFSNPFSSIPEMIQHYSLNKLPIKGAEHMSLLYPVIDQLL